MFTRSSEYASLPSIFKQDAPSEIEKIRRISIAYFNLDIITLFTFNRLMSELAVMKNDIKLEVILDTGCHMALVTMLSVLCEFIEGADSLSTVKLSGKAIEGEVGMRLVRSACKNPRVMHFDFNDVKMTHLGALNLATIVAASSTGRNPCVHISGMAGYGLYLKNKMRDCRRVLPELLPTESRLSHTPQKVAFR